MRVKAILLTAAAAATMLGFAANEGQAQDAADPIRLGFLTVHSGPLAAGGRQMEEGLKLCLDERGYEMSGREIELFIADTAGQPAQTRTKTQELVERNNVHVLIGPLAAFEALAIDDYIREVEIPIISPSAAAEDLTQRQLNPWFVRAVGTSAQANHALGEYAAKELGFERVVTIADDFAYGHELTKGFERTFEENGGEVVENLWPPLNVADYGPYIAQFPSDIDAIFAGFAGANGLRFLGTLADYGIDLPILGTMTTVDEGILKNMGDEALGVISAGWYSAASDTPENQEFVEKVNEAYGADPGYYTAGTYTACQFMEAALEAVDGKIEDKEAFREALRNVEIESGPRGRIALDEYGNPVMDIYIRKVVRGEDGKLKNEVVETYENVSQFWTYDPEEFLAQPVYSRDWTPSN